jgi:SOS-response transcriptional repressor LexA
MYVARGATAMPGDTTVAFVPNREVYLRRLEGEGGQGLGVGR